MEEILYELTSPLKLKVLTGWNAPFTGCGGELFFEEGTLLRFDDMREDVQGYACEPIDYEKYLPQVIENMKEDVDNPEHWWEGAKKRFGGYYCHIDKETLQENSIKY